MKRIFVLQLLLMGFCLAFGQTAKERVMKDTSLCGFVYTLYPTEFKAQTPVPEGYEPIYISHYGRHGSRYVIDEKYFRIVYDAFLKAEKAGGLTLYGKEIYNRFMKAAECCLGRGGDVTQIGLDQHRGIAERMYKAYPEIFTHNPYILSLASVSQRAIMSMAAFTNQLQKIGPDLDIKLESGQKFMPELNPYHLDPESAHRIDMYRYPYGPWSKDVDKFKEEHVDETRILKAMFTKEYLDSGLLTPVFVKELFRNCVCLPGTDSDVRLYDVFTKEELYQWWRLFNMKFYFEKGHSDTGGGFLNDVCLSMLETFIARAEKCVDEKVHGEGPCVTLRFGHDGCIIGLLNLMGVQGFGQKAASLEDIENVFFSSDIPMAATLMWIFYRNKTTGDVLLKMTLNENELDFPMESDCKPYVHWNDFKTKYKQVIEYVKNHQR